MTIAVDWDVKPQTKQTNIITEKSKILSHLNTFRIEFDPNERLHCVPALLSPHCYTSLFGSLGIKYIN